MNQRNSQLQKRVQLLAVPSKQGTPTTAKFFQAVHYNPVTQAFDERSETIRIPQALPNAAGVLQSTPRDLEKAHTRLATTAPLN